MRSWADKTAKCGALAALALMVGCIENMIPLPVAAPGVKLGLANIVTLIALYTYGFPAALAVSAVRVLLSGFMFTGINALLYALAGAMTSLCGMALARRTGLFSIIGVSVTGALLHNAAQYAVAALITRTAGLLSYLPILLLAASLTGIIVGFVAALLLGRLSGMLKASAGSGKQ